MARKPIRKLSDIPGVFTGPVAPANPARGDLWFQTPDITPPVIGALAATGGAGTLSLSWPAATDDVGVTLYEYTYGTAADYVGATVATTATLSAALSVAAGTYYCRLRARDAAGNWSSYSTASAVATAASYTAPVISGTLTATAGASSAVLTGPTATGTITKWQYTKDAGTTWVDVASTAATFPSTTVSPLTPLNPVTFGVRAVNVTAVSSTLNGTCTPFYLNDFSAGQALDTTNLAAYTAGSGTAAVASNLWKFVTAAAADAAGGVYKTSVSKTATRVFSVKFTCPAITSTGVPQENAIGLRASATQPGAIASASDDARVFLEVAGQSDTTVYIYGQYYDATGPTWKYSTGAAWSASNTPYSLTTGTTYIAEIEVDPNAGTPRWRFILRNAAGTALFTTPYVNFASVQGDATNTYWVDSGDRFNDIRYGTLALSYFKVAG